MGMIKVVQPHLPQKNNLTMMKSQYPKIINGALIGIYVAFASLIIKNDVSSLYLAIACFILIILITLFNNEFLENIQKIDINKFWSKPWINSVRRSSNKFTCVFTISKGVQLIIKCREIKIKKYGYRNGVLHA